MVNNYWFEIAAFILELVIGYMLIFRTSITLPYSKIFKKVYLCSLISSAAALAQVLIECYIKNNNNKDIANYTIILNILSMFFSMLMFCAVLFLLFMSIQCLISG